MSEFTLSTSLIPRTLFFEYHPFISSSQPTTSPITTITFQDATGDSSKSFHLLPTAKLQRQPTSHVNSWEFPVLPTNSCEQWLTWTSTAIYSYWQKSYFSCSVASLHHQQCLSSSITLFAYVSCQFCWCVFALRDTYRNFSLNCLWVMNFINVLLYIYSADAFIQRNLHHVDTTLKK